MLQGSCGLDCHHWNSCETKWYRGERGETQICCPLWEEFYQYNPDFPQINSEDYPQRLIKTVYHHLDHEQFVTAHHFALLLPNKDFITLRSLRGIYKNCYKKTKDRRYLDEGISLFQNFLRQTENKAAVLINLAHLVEFEDPTSADEAILEALKENPLLSPIVRFYRKLREEKPDCFKRLSALALKAQNPTLQTLCNEISAIDSLLKTENPVDLVSVIDKYENLLSEVGGTIESAELGKLANRGLNTAIRKLEHAGDSCSKSGNSEDAKKWYSSAVKGLRLFLQFKPKEPSNYAKMVAILNKQLERTRSHDSEKNEVEERILEYSRQASELMPQMSENVPYHICRNYGTMFRILGERNEQKANDEDSVKCYQLAVEWYKKASGIFNPPSDRVAEKRLLQTGALEMGVCLLKLQKSEEAIFCYEAVLNKYPDWYEGHISKGDAFLKIGEIEKAENEYKISLEMRPEDIPAYDKLTYLYEYKKQYKDAVFTWTKYMRLPLVLRKKELLDWGYFRLARLYEDWGQDKIAGNLYRYIIEKGQPDHLEAHDRLFNIYKKHSRWGDAATVLEKKMALSIYVPYSDLPALSDMANYHAEQNEIDRAIDYVTRIIGVVGEQSSKAPDDFFWRAQLYLKKHDEERARLDFLKAIELYERHEGDIDADPERKNQYDRSTYNWGQCLFWTGKIPESIRRFEVNLERSLSATYRMKTYAWLIKLYGIAQKWDKQEEVKKRILSDDEIKGVPLNDISTDKLEVLLELDKMKEYIRQIDDRLSRGDHWAVLEELKNLHKLHRLFEGHDDTVLLTKIAQAEMGTKDYESALKTLNYVRQLDPSQQNQSQALAYVGKAYMAQGKYMEARSAFAESYTIGGHISMLIAQATALRKLQDYDGAIGLYKKIIESIKDKEPWKTKTGLAQTYWSKYSRTQSISDLQNAITCIYEILRDRPDDWHSYRLLFAISNKSDKFSLILPLLQKESLLIGANVLKWLATYNDFDPRYISGCLQRLRSEQNVEARDSDFAKASADYLMKATVYSYFFGKEVSEYAAFLKLIVEGIAEYAGPFPLLREYLCGSRGAYIEFIDMATTALITKHLDIEEGATDIGAIIRERLIPAIRKLLLAPQAGCPNVHYQQKDPQKATEWREKIDGHIAKRPAEKHIFVQWDLNSEENMPAQLPWHFTKEFFFWLLPNRWDINFAWCPVYNADSDISMIVRKGDQSIEFIITASYVIDTLDNFEDSKTKTCQSHRECPVPNGRYGMSYSFDTSQMNSGKLQAKVQVSLGAPAIIPEELKEFWSFMSQSFSEGLVGNFSPSEFRQSVNRRFPNSEFQKSFGTDRWIEFIQGFIDHHFSLALLSYLEHMDFHKQLHDCQKKSDIFIRQEPPYPEELVTDFLCQVTAFKYTLGAQRKRQLISNLIGVETVLRTNLEEIMRDVIESEQRTEGSVQYITDFDECGLVSVDEPLIKRAFSSLIRNASIATAKVAADRVITVSLRESDNKAVVTIDNPYNEDAGKTSTGTGYGLIDARAIIDNVHKGHLSLCEDSPKKGFYRAIVSLPLQTKE